MTMLFDFTAELLTERQKEFFDLYYNEDLSLAEIAERRHLPQRPGRDRPGGGRHAGGGGQDRLIRRFEQMRGHLQAIEDAAAELKTINYRQYEDPRLTELAELIHAEATALKE